jgi:hypothetical protein
VIARNIVRCERRVEPAERCTAAMVGTHDYATVRDLAKAEAINESYLGRVLRLTLLSPTLIKAILEGRQPATLELDGLMKQFPIEWDRQLGSLTEG